jgi:demethylmenaquinone methyltransferase/2-methoxy-6-polyprenyl-1,4-benzoquinol methylase
MRRRSILNMGYADSARDLDALLAEQLTYYRALAPEYGQTTIPGVPPDEKASGGDALLTALDELCPRGDVLELACEPGTWTPFLLRHAERLTAVDAAPEMLALAAEKVGENRVRFLRADVFGWKPDRRYDVVSFGFWLSHVPLERFDAFWGLIRRCLKPNGRVAFADDGHRAPDEFDRGKSSSVIARRLNDGTGFRAVKVPHTPRELEERLHNLGWSITVRYVSGPFFWGQGTPSFGAG